MLIKNEYFKILELLDNEEYRMVDISKELNVGIDVVKKLSQVKNIREKFNEMDLNEEDNIFLYDLWFNIIYLKDVDDKDDIRDIINFLKAVTNNNNDVKLNKDIMYISKFCLASKKSKIRDIERIIEKRNRDLERYNNLIRDRKSLSKEFLNIEKNIDKILKEYPESKREFIKNMFGIRKGDCYDDRLRYEVIMRYNVSTPKFSELKKHGAIRYDRYDYYCEIIDIEKFINIMSKTKKQSIDTTPRTKNVISLSEIKKFSKDNYEKNKIKDIKKEIEKCEQEKDEELKSGIITEFEYISKEYYKLKKKLNEMLLVNYPSTEMMISDKTNIYVKNLFDIKRTHYVAIINNEVIAYVCFPEIHVHTYCLGLFGSYVNSIKESREEYIISKLKKHVDKICFIPHYEEVTYEGNITDTARELTKFNIYRKLNKEFLFPN